MLHYSGSPFPSLSLPTTFGMRSFIKIKPSQKLKILPYVFSMIIMDYFMNAAALKRCYESTSILYIVKRGLQF